MLHLNSRQRKNKTGRSGRSIQSITHSTAAKKDHQHCRQQGCPITALTVLILLCCCLNLFFYFHAQNKITKLITGLSSMDTAAAVAGFEKPKLLKTQKKASRGIERPILGETTKG